MAGRGSPPRGGRGRARGASVVDTARAAAGVVLTAAAGLAAAHLASARLAFPVRVTSNSMAPYVWRGDHGVAVHAREVRRGDVVVFRFPFGAPDLAIKRAVALPGDCIPRRGASDASLGGGAAAAAPACEVVPPGSVYVVGDNAEWSIDSRSFGPVPSAEVVGKLVLAVPVARWLARWRAAAAGVEGTSADAGVRLPGGAGARGVRELSA